MDIEIAIPLQCYRIVAFQIAPTQVKDRNRAVVYINLKEYEKAQADLLKAIKIGSRNSQAYGNLGIVAFVKQDYPLAVKYLEQAIAIDPNNKEARNLLMHIKGE